MIPDPRDADIVYGTSENLIGRFNKHTMQLQVISVWPIDASGHAAKRPRASLQLDLAADACRRTIPTRSTTAWSGSTATTDDGMQLDGRSAPT